MSEHDVLEKKRKLSAALKANIARRKSVRSKDFASPAGRASPSAEDDVRSPKPTPSAERQEN